MYNPTLLYWYGKFLKAGGGKKSEGLIYKRWDT